MGIGHAWGDREKLLHPRGFHGRFRTTPNHIVDKIMGILDAFNPRSFPNDDAAGNYVHSHARSNRFLTNAGSEIDHFVGGFSTINHGLQTGQLTPRDQETMKVMDKAMQPLPEDLILTRVTGPETFGLNQGNFAHIQDLEGMLVSSPGYSATTIGTPHPTSGPHVTMAIAAPKGTPALMPAIGKPTREVILPRDQEFRITSVDSDGMGGYNVMAVAVPKGESKAAPEANAPGLTPKEPTPQAPQAPAAPPPAAPAPAAPNAPAAPGGAVQPRNEPIHAETVGAQPSLPTTPSAPAASTPPPTPTVPETRPGRDIRSLVREAGIEAPSPGPRRLQFNKAFLGVASGKQHPADMLRDLESDIKHNEHILAEDAKDGTDSGPLPDDIKSQRALADLIRHNFIPVAHQKEAPAPAKAAKVVKKAAPKRGTTKGLTPEDVKALESAAQHNPTMGPTPKAASAKKAAPAAPSTKAAPAKKVVPEKAAAKKAAGTPGTSPTKRAAGGAAPAKATAPKSAKAPAVKKAAPAAPSAKPTPAPAEHIPNTLAVGKTNANRVQVGDKILVRGGEHGWGPTSTKRGATEIIVTGKTREGGGIVISGRTADGKEIHLRAVVSHQTFHKSGEAKLVDEGPKKAAPAVKKVAEKAAPAKAPGRPRGKLTARNVKDGEPVIWERQGETPVRGRVVKEGRSTFIDWEGGRRERITGYGGPGPNVRPATAEEAHGLPAKVKTIQEPKAAVAKKVAEKAVPKKAAPAAKKAAPAAKKVAEKAVPKPHGLPNKVAQAQARQADIDKAKKHAEVAGVLEEAINSEMGHDKAAVNVQQAALRTGLTREMGPVVDALRAGDEKKARSEMTKILKEQGITQHGNAGQVGKFDRKAHQAISGTRIPEAHPVTTIKPGFTFKRGSESIPLSKSVVEKGVPTRSDVHEALAAHDAASLRQIGRDANLPVPAQARSKEAIIRYLTTTAAEHDKRNHGGTGATPSQNNLKRLAGEAGAAKPPVGGNIDEKTSLADLRKMAKERGVAIPGTMRTKAAIREHLQNTPTSPGSPAETKQVAKKATAAVEKVDTGARVNLWHETFKNAGIDLPEGTPSRKAVDDALAEAKDPPSLRAQAKKLDKVAADLREQANKELGANVQGADGRKAAEVRLHRAEQIEKAAQVMKELAGNRRAPKKTAEPDLAPDAHLLDNPKTTVPQIRAYARDKGIAVPNKVRTKKDLVEHIKGQEAIAKAPTPAAKATAVADVVTKAATGEAKSPMEHLQEVADKLFKTANADQLREAAKIQGIDVPSTAKTKGEVFQEILKAAILQDKARRDALKVERAAKKGEAVAKKAAAAEAAVKKAVPSAPTESPAKVSLRAVMKEKNLLSPSFIPANRALNKAGTDLMGGKDPALVAKELRAEATKINRPGARSIEDEASRIKLDPETLKARQKDGVNVLRKVAEGLDAKAKAAKKAAPKAAVPKAPAVTPGSPTDHLKSTELFLKNAENAKEAKAYLEAQKLTVPKIRELMDHLGVKPGNAGTKDQLLETIVQYRVQSRLNSDAIRGTNPLKTMDKAPDISVPKAAKSVEKLAATTKAVSGKDGLTATHIRDLKEMADQPHNVVFKMSKNATVNKRLDALEKKGFIRFKGGGEFEVTDEGRAFVKNVGAPKLTPEQEKTAAGIARMAQGGFRNSEPPAISKMATHPILPNHWGSTGGEVHFHKDGAIGMAIDRMGADKNLDVNGDGEPLANVLGRLATDVVRGNKTQQDMINEMKNIRDRLPIGSSARTQVEDAIKRMDTPPRAPIKLPEDTPAPIKDLMEALSKIPIARQDWFGKPSDMDRLAQRVQEFNDRYKGATPETKARAWKIRGPNIFHSLENQHHESREGKFEVDRVIRQALARLELK